MALSPVESDEVAFLRVHLDWVGIVGSAAYSQLANVLGAAVNISPQRVLIGFSHTHAAGIFSAHRTDKPGGELIRPYLVSVQEKLADAARRAVVSMQPVVMTHAAGSCAMGRNRDYWDQKRGRYVCGFNPDAASDQTLMVVRITDASVRPVGTIVNYGCHPTTLAWDNTLVSPDYVGAMRELVEQHTEAPCVFALGACGDVGPQAGFVGDPHVADRNGRQLGFAALSTLMSMGPPQTDFVYQGPVVSGATLGTWAHVPFDATRAEQVKRFDGGTYSVQLPTIDLLDSRTLRRDLDDWTQKAASADRDGHPIAARDAAAQAERARRWLERLESIPADRDFPLSFSVLRMGDALWVSCAGEPYACIEVELRRRLSRFAVIFTPLVGPMDVAYLLPADRYGKGLYQQEPSMLAAGCLERLVEAIAQKIEALL